jgi:hypothetical protein
MKIGTPQTPSQSVPADRARETQTPRPDTDRREDSPARRFGSALEKKATEKKKMEQSGESGELSAPPPLSQLPFQPPSFAAPVEAAATGAVGGVMPPELAALAGEIQHAIEVSGPNEIRIQFDAAVLDGLSVTLTREGGALQVNLQANSLEMARFLEVHAASLAQSLERPERSAYISIEARPQPGERQGGRGQEDRQDEQRERRDQGSEGEEL